MDYKKIIKNRQTRLRIIKIFDFIPDRAMLRLQYRIKTGRKLNLINPVRYTEKLQWYKLFYRDTLMTLCSDKFEVRKYVKSKGLEKILNPIYGVYNTIEEINLETLPKSFAIKQDRKSVV